MRRTTQWGRSSKKSTTTFRSRTPPMRKNTRLFLQVDLIITVPVLVPSFKSFIAIKNAAWFKKFCYFYRMKQLLSVVDLPVLYLKPFVLDLLFQR
jgi:hypothetical protein